MTGYFVLLAVLGAERLFELRLSRRNAEWSRRRNAVEAGRGTFRLMAALHAAFLPACALEVWLAGRPFLPALGLPAFGVLLGAQALRYWAVATLGPRWNVRVLVVPGAPAVAGGPYRFLRHPNYLAVVLEGMAVPLVHTAWITAIAFTCLNLPLLAARVRCEEELLRLHSDYEQRLVARPRFLPLRSRRRDS